jgi:hypothetical protein
MVMRIVAKYRKLVLEEMAYRGLVVSIDGIVSQAMGKQVSFDLWRKAVMKVMGEEERRRFSELSNNEQETYFSHDSKMSFQMFMNTPVRDIVSTWGAVGSTVTIH